MRLLFVSMVVAALIVMLAFEVWMFLDAIKNKKLTDTERILWVLGMLLLHPIIAIVYYFTARSTLNPR